MARMDLRIFVRRCWPAALLLSLWLGALGPVRSAAPDFLDPDAAFALTARPASERALQLDFTIAPGYYLYREQFKVAARGATLGTPVIPPGHSKFDETFQKEVEIYRGHVSVIVPVQQADRDFQVLIGNQGCADRGLCYPPQQRGADASLVGFGGSGRVALLPTAQSEALATAMSAPAGASSGTVGPSAAAPGLSAGDARDIDRVLRGSGLWTIAGVFFVAGVLLSLTPCVLPMLPILASIIVGRGGAVSRGRGLVLAVAYSLGMALVYTLLGIGAGLAGEGLSAALQKPWVLSLFAAGLVGLGLSMFGAYDLQLPTSWAGRMSTASRRLPTGRIAGVFGMGGVSALLVSPCVAAPLAGALVYIGQTRDVWLGGLALFALAAGMSLPLLLVGASAGVLLPRAGAWMDDVKRFFGWLLLGVALWTVQPLLPPAVALIGWGAVALGAAVTLTFGARRRLSRGPLRLAVAAVLAGVGLSQLVGAATGGSDPLAPLAALALVRTDNAPRASRFAAIRTLADLDTALRSAGRPVVLDFYADWCVSCKEMERFTFVDPAVRSRIDGALLLRADVTANNDDDRALLKRFQLFGPPGMIFFDAQGREVPGTRVIGFENAPRFVETLHRAGL